MNLSYSVAAFVVSAALAGPLLAQQEPNRGQAPQARPPAAQTPAPAADAPAPIVRQPSPAELETQRRRDERSVDLDELLARMSEATGVKFLVDPRVRAQVTTVPKIET